MIVQQKTYEDYKKDRHLRKKYYLYTCFDGLTKHKFFLEIPHADKTKLYKYYDIELDYSAKGEYRTYQALMFKCAFCSKTHFTTPKICKKCKKFINPVGKNLKNQLSGVFYTLVCKCKLYDNNK